MSRLWTRELWFTSGGVRCGAARRRRQARQFFGSSPHDHSSPRASQFRLVLKRFSQVGNHDGLCPRRSPACSSVSRAAIRQEEPLRRGRRPSPTAAISQTFRQAQEPQCRCQGCAGQFRIIREHSEIHHQFVQHCRRHFWSSWYRLWRNSCIMGFSQPHRDHR